MNEIKTIQDFYTEAHISVEYFNTFVEKHNFSGKGIADHICFKCGSKESFEFIRALFENESAYIYQSIISKRRIAIVKLKQAISTHLGDITMLELSDQKPDGSQKEGFDHIEVYPVGQTYAEMVADLEKTEIVKKVERPHHTTYDIQITDDFIFRCTEGPLLEKIKNSEM